MDGVIVDSEPLWEEAATRYLITIGVKLPTSRKFQHYIDTHIRGRKWEEVVNNFKKKLGVKQSYQQITRGCLKELFILFNKELKTNPGAISLIKHLCKNGYPILLASSAPRPSINLIIKKFHLRKYLKHIISGDNVTKGKPHPEIFLKSAKKLKLKPSQILVIEDSISGVRAAYRAGMKCIALKQPYTAKKYLRTADLVVNKLSQISIKKIQELK
ncbi:HAD family phosphatase [Patescibacteria group bacterium]|nr:HAD family phosphatase [Patescibacteria group bacterium]